LQQHADGLGKGAWSNPRLPAAKIIYIGWPRSGYLGSGRDPRVLAAGV